jgi:hypothetical protein
MIENRRARSSWIAVIACGTLLASCTHDGHTAHEATRSTRAAGDELRASERMWSAAEGTITYGTERTRPGEPISSHQCLRQLVGDAIDIPTGLRMCDRSGMLTLTWEPTADRWRMDLEERGIRTTVIGDGRSRSVCRYPSLGMPDCLRVDRAVAVRSAPFRWLVLPIARTLRELGIAKTASVAASRRVVADRTADCFEVGSEVANASWCFTDEGLLVYLALRSAGQGSMTLEAERISPEVSPSAFEAVT